MHNIIAKIIERQHLSRQEAFAAMEEIMSGAATPAQIGAFLIAMRMKGEQADEIAGFAASMRANASTVSLENAPDTVDLVGTGGDGKNTFNISTAAALVVAAAGVPVAKHGNRSVSSKCGSADVLRALGINVEINARQMEHCLQQAGIAFLYAPKLHPAMKHAIGPRREIGVRSVFNILGPLTNPAGVKRQLLGVYDRALAPLFAEVLRQLEAQHVLVVHSAEGMDEFSIAGPNHVVELRDGDIRAFELSPRDFGLTASDDSLGGGDADENAAIIRAILGGEKSARRDVVLMNAAAGLYVAGVAANFMSAAQIAAESIDSGAARQKLQALIEVSHEYS